MKTNKSVTVIQLTDTHLNTADAAHHKRWQLIRTAILEAKPDRLIVTGDLTDDGLLEQNAHLLTDFRDLLDALDIPYHVLPGNHDIGNRVGFPHPANAPALNRWINVFADHTFAIDDIPRTCGWQLLGIDTMILGTGLDHEQRQYDWLKKKLTDPTHAHHKLAVFTHAPLFLNSPNEHLPQPSDYWCPPPSGRDPIWQALIDTDRLHLIAHGHLHHHYISQDQDAENKNVGPIRVGAPPATGILVKDSNFPHGPSALQECGLMRYAFHPHGVKIDHIALNIPTRTSRFRLKNPE